METMVGGRAGAVIEAPTPATGIDYCDISPAAAWRALAVASVAVVGSVPRVWELSDQDLLGVLVAERESAARREAARLALVRELDARGVAAQGGATSTAAFLAHRLLVDPAVAARDVKAARALDPAGDVPPAPGAPAPSRTRPDVVLAATGRDLAGGAVSRAHADVVTGLVRSLPAPAAGGTPTDRQDRTDLHARAEAFLLDHARRFCPADLRRLGRHLRHLVDPDGALGDERRAERSAPPSAPTRPPTAAPASTSSSPPPSTPSSPA
jgi:hypothetical protein